MFDLGRAVALLFAFSASVRVRSVTGMIAALAVAYLLLVQVVAGLVRSADATSIWTAFIFVFLGPSGAPSVGGEHWPLGAAIVQHPVLVHALAASGAIVPMWRLRLRSAKLRPEIEEARDLDRAELRFTLVLVFEGILAMVALGAFYFSRD